MGRNQGLQALRGIAATTVFIHHLKWPLFEVLGIEISFYDLGSADVLIFFALSGYLMTYREHRSAQSFAIDRLRRLLPGYWIALPLVALIDWWVLGRPVEIDTRLFFLYPAGHQLRTLLPYWTLVFELGFYALVLAAILAVRSRAWLFVMVCLALSYALFERPYLWETAAFPGWSGLLFSWYNLFFLVGVIVGRLPVLSIGRWTAPVFVTIRLAIFLIRWSLPFPSFDGYPTIALALSLGFLLAASISWRATDWIGRAFNAIGNASYGIYLTHVGFLYLAAAVIARAGISPFLPAWLTIACVAALAFSLSYTFGMAEWSMQAWLKTATRTFSGHDRKVLLPAE